MLLLSAASWLLTASLVGAAPSAPPAPQALQGAQVIALLNAQRAANGIPPITTLDQSFASWCPDEQAPFSGQELGRVSAPRDDLWGPTQTPYRTAPLHQYLMYDPAYTIAGDVHALDGTDCMGLGGAGSEPSTVSIYAFVNEAGPLTAPSEELASEGPTTPQQEVGLPASRVTGPQISLYALGLGPGVRVTGISLSSANGTPVSEPRIALNANGGILVPPPLQPGMAYRLQVAWTALSGQTATQALAFSTVARANPSGISLLRARAGLVRMRVQTASRGAQLTLSGPHRLVRAVGSPAPRGRTIDLHLGRGRWQACLASGGGSSGYLPARDCIVFSVHR